MLLEAAWALRLCRYEPQHQHPPPGFARNLIVFSSCLSQLVKLAGAKAIAVAGTESKLEYATQLGAVATANYKSEDFSEIVEKVTEGKGVNVILDCVGGSFWEKNAKSIAMDGRWVLYGLLGGPTVEGPLLRFLLSKRVQLMATTLRTRPLRYKVRLLSAPLPSHCSLRVPHQISLSEEFAENVVPALSKGKVA